MPIRKQIDWRAREQERPRWPDLFGRRPSNARPRRSVTPAVMEAQESGEMPAIINIVYQGRGTGDLFLFFFSLSLSSFSRCFYQRQLGDSGQDGENEPPTMPFIDFFYVCLVWTRRDVKCRVRRAEAHFVLLTVTYRGRTTRLSPGSRVRWPVRVAEMAAASAVAPALVFALGARVASTARPPPECFSNALEKATPIRPH